jgi:hypothetical protein
MISAIRLEVLQRLQRLIRQSHARLAKYIAWPIVALR